MIQKLYYRIKRMHSSNMFRASLARTTQV